jgi:hypothetical protein
MQSPYHIPPNAWALSDRDPTSFGASAPPSGKVLKKHKFLIVTFGTLGRRPRLTPKIANLIVSATPIAIALHVRTNWVGRPNRAKTYGKNREHGPKSYDFPLWTLAAFLRRYKPADYCVQ